MLRKSRPLIMAFSLLFVFNLLLGACGGPAPGASTPSGSTPVKGGIWIDNLFEYTGRKTCHDRPTTRENYFDDRSLLCPMILDKDGHCFTEASGQDLCLK